VAAQQYDDINSATAHYNRGNALAKAGQYPEAIKAYEDALRMQPGMADASANKRAVEAAMKRQQQSQSKQGEQRKSQGNQEGQSQAQPGQPSSSKNAGQDNTQQPSAKQDAQQWKGEQPQPQEAQAQPQDAKAQQQADQAQRERMQRALEQARRQDGRQPPQEAARAKETPGQRERRLANEAWLKRVPDDPGGLLRAKFRLEYERRVLQGRAEE
jgi:Ca-activated chloride channel homolog